MGHAIHVWNVLHTMANLVDVIRFEARWLSGFRLKALGSGDMARRPDVPCAGCGKLIWRGTGSLPKGRARCRDCGGSPRGAIPTSVFRLPKPAKTCECGQFHVRRSPWCTSCARRMTNDRAISKNSARRRGFGNADVTTTAIRHMRCSARRCRVCAVFLIRVHGLPQSPEIDHIIPLNIGGRHVLANLRVLCRRCNLLRPKDGSDIEGDASLYGGLDQDVARAYMIAAQQHRPAVQPKIIARVSMSKVMIISRAWAAKRMREQGVRWQDIADWGFNGNVGNAHTAVQRYCV